MLSACRTYVRVRTGTRMCRRNNELLYDVRTAAISDLLLKLLKMMVGSSLSWSLKCGTFFQYAETLNKMETR
jgi:hypothetical protein